MLNATSNHKTNNMEDVETVPSNQMPLQLKMLLERKWAPVTTTRRVTSQMCQPHNSCTRGGMSEAKTALHLKLKKRKQKILKPWKQMMLPTPKEALQWRGKHAWM